MASFLSTTYLVLGVLSHLLYFIRGEHDLHAFQIVSTSFVVQTCLLAYFFRIDGFSKDAWFHFTSVNCSYAIGLFASITIYRLAFHPLRRIPGPFPAKISRFYSIWLSRNLNYHLELCKLHEKYGDIVRIGPNELSFSSVDGLIAIHGTGSTFGKGPIFNVVGHKGVFNVGLTRDMALWRKRRRVWEQALNTKALNDYEIHVQQTIDSWCKQVGQHQGRPMEITTWARLIAFDFMGGVGFSQRWKAVEAGKESKILELLIALIKPVGYLGRHTWLLSLLDVTVTKLGLSTEARIFASWVTETMEMREKDKSAGPDVAGWLLQDFENSEKRPEDRYMLEADTQFLTIAAANTTSTALAWTLHYLAKYPAAQQRLRDALDPIFGQDRKVAHRQLAQVPLLTAVINEAMRLQPPVGVGDTRISAPEGQIVGDTRIPGGVHVIVLFQALNRDPRYFKKPLEYIPERFTTSPELCIDKRAFAPFLIGPHTCSGKALALMELRLVVAYTIYLYQFSFAPGESGKRMEADAIDISLMRPGPCNLSFRRRDGY